MREERTFLKPLERYAREVYVEILIDLSLCSELAGSNRLQSLLVALGNVLFKTRAFNAPLVTSTNLNGGKFAATHQSTHLRKRNLQLLGNVAQSEETRCSHRIIPFRE